MSLRYIVPTLGLLAASAPAFAADVGGLTVDGYVDTVLTFEDDDVAEDSTIDFSSAAQLEVGYAIGETVDANVELYWAEDEDDESATVIDLEQAYVSWDVSDKATITMGKFENWLGYEASDAPDLYRVGTSLVSNELLGNNVTGVSLGYTINEELGFGVYVVDTIYGGLEYDLNGDGTIQDNEKGAQKSDELAIGADLTYALAGIGTFDLDLMYDQGISLDKTGESADAFGIDFNVEIDSLQDSGWLFAGEINYLDYDLDSSLGFMAMANYTFAEDAVSIPMGLTLMISQVEKASDADDTSAFEVALALLTNPTGDANFAANVEIKHVSEDKYYAGSGANAKENDTTGVYFELLAIIP